MVDREAGTQTGPGPRSQWRSSKLRDSCQACAVSKVKCPKQKPACSRCESRNIACEYFFTKRPGRRRENSTAGQKTTASSGPATPEPISGPASNTELDGSWTRYADTIHALQPIPRPYFLPGIITPPGDGPPSLRIPASPRVAENVSATNGSELFSVLANMNTTALSLAYFSSDVSDMDFITSGMESPPELSMQDVSDSSSSSNTQSQIDVASLLMPVGNDTHAPDSSAASESSSSSAADLLNAASGATPPPSNITQRPTGGPLTIDTPTPPPSCGCLARALDLLKTLSSTNNPNSPASATLVGSDATVRVSDPVQTRTVLQKNKQGIEAVEGMLACSSCTHDSFLLTVLATAVLKILELYSAAASSPPPHPGVEPEADDKTTRQAKLVLSELHRAQRVVNKLSPKLKAPPSPERSMPKHGGSGSRWPVIGEPLPASGLQTISPFSVGTLEMVANDVRNCLGTLSAELINNLRQI